MYFLMAGLTLFFGIHVVSAVPLRGRLIKRHGLPRYRRIFTALAFAGLALIVYGKSSAEFIPVWHPPYWTRYLVMGLMPLALLSLAMPDIKNNFRRYVRHPMMTGVGIWSGAHLTANGDLASVLLFSGFLLYSIFSMIPGYQHKTYVRPDKVPFRYDVMVIVVTIVGYLVILNFHQFLSGIRLI